MTILENIATIYIEYPAIRLFVVPSILVLFAYLIFKRRDELSLHAFQNTGATIIIVGVNMLAIMFFVGEINAFAQSVYASLRIPTLPATFWDPLPIWLVAIFGLVAKDFADYWNHRLMHTTWIWPTHAAHHSDTQVNAFTTFRIHFLETIFMSLSYVVLLTWLQMPAIIPALLMFSHLHNLYVHTNLPWQHGPFKLILASPAFHRWHHADVKAAYGKNLANVIPAWDALFGTYYNPGLCEAQMGAKSCGIEDKNPILILIYPFQQWAYLIRRRILGRAAKQPRVHPAE